MQTACDKLSADIARPRAFLIDRQWQISVSVGGVGGQGRLSRANCGIKRLGGRCRAGLGQFLTSQQQVGAELHRLPFGRNDSSAGRSPRMRSTAS